MKMRACLTILLTLTVLSFAAVSSADGVTKRIRFARGKHSATVSNSVIRGDVDTYILGARAGQTLSAKIRSIENNAVFDIEGPDGEYLPGAGEGDDATQVTAVLPMSGDYKVVVGGTRGNATYKLTVSIR
jgi:type II secretory pathway pseudopilin PulG